jgi:GNAT superfamily N-acetyltransferase
MKDRLVEERRDALVLSTDRRRIDVERILGLLLVSHWGGGMTRHVLQRAIENSVCVGVYDTAAGGRQVAFARAVTDLATYAYFTDVIVAEPARGKGIGSWMVGALVGHPDLQGLRRIALWTRDARGLYEKFGFSTDMPASTYMELRTRR